MNSSTKYNFLYFILAGIARNLFMCLSVNFGITPWVSTIIIIIPCDFFTQVFVNGFSPEWQQVSSGLQDSSQYSGRSQQCCNLDGLDSSSNFQCLSFAFFFKFHAVIQQNGIIISSIIYSLEFFPSANADGLSLEFEWEQVSSSLLDSSQYSWPFSIM